MEATTRKNESWTLLSHLIIVLVLAIDICVHAESSFDGDITGCMFVFDFTTQLNGFLSYCYNIRTANDASKVERPDTFTEIERIGKS